MGRYLFPILFAVVLVSPFVLRLAIGAGDEAEQADVAAASRRLVIVTPHNRDIQVEYDRAFNDWHQRTYGEAVNIDYRNVGGTGDIVKALTDYYNAVRERNDGELPPIEDVSAPYDMVWGGGDYEFDRNLEGRAGALQPMELSESVMQAAFPEPDLAGIKLYDQDDDGMHWVGVCLSSFGIVYSPFLYERLDLEPPTTWTDLTRPELHELVVLADPNKSGSASVAYMMVLQRAIADAEEAYLDGRELTDEIQAEPAYAEALNAGWMKGTGDLMLMAANARYFTDSASAVPAEVSHSNAAAGTAIDFYGRVETELAGEDRIVYVVPEAATAVTPDPIAICYGTTGEQLELATRFTEFLLSSEGQQLWIKRASSEGGPRDRSLRRTPIVPSVFADQTDWTDLNDPFTTSGGFNQRGAWMGEFTETRMIWNAAWVGAGDAMDNAYAAVLDVPAGPKRDALIARFRDVPTSWDKVRDIRAEIRSREDAEQTAFKARLTADLSAKFRKHFDAVKSAARAAG